MDQLSEPTWQSPPGADLHRRHRLAVRWELVGCALKSHVLVGTDAATIRSEDDALVRVTGEQRWHRCLRCDAWVCLPTPTEPRRDHIPPAMHIELPLRGKPLRDRWVLRLIAAERVLHVILFLGAAIAILLFAQNRQLLEADFRAVTEELTKRASTPGHGLLAEVAKLFTFSSRSLYTVVGIAVAYAALESVEAVGLWFARRWAEYLTLVATVLLLPIEIFALLDRVTVLKLLLFAINVAVALYLLWAKRLFGIRGGGRTEAAERDRDRGWAPVDRATPPSWSDG